MKVLREYRMRTYSDGTIEVKEVKPTDDFKEILDNCSDKIRQAILVILQIKSLKEKETKDIVDYSKLYNESINLVSDNLQLERATVHDKLERRMNKSAKEMKKLVEEYFEGLNKNIRQVMLDSVSNSTKKKQDSLAIEELFKRL